MKRTFAVAVVILICLISLSAVADKKNDSPNRLLTGQVTNNADAPLANAIVYLKNTKTLVVKTFITDATGNYRFPELSPNIDYQIYAEHNGAKSDTKTLSSFDSRSKPTINLRIAGEK